MRLNHKSTSNMYMLSFFWHSVKRSQRITVIEKFRLWCDVITMTRPWRLSIDNILNDDFELWMGGGSSRNAVWKSATGVVMGEQWEYIRLYGSPCRRPRENHTIIHVRLFIFRQFILQSLQNKLLFTSVNLFKVQCSKGKQKRCRTQRGQR